MLQTEGWIASNDLAFALFDGFPVSPGHALVVPRRLVAKWFEGSGQERMAIFEVIDIVKARLDATLQPHGCSIGINAGLAAGPIAMHPLVQLIPRFDVPRPT